MGLNDEIKIAYRAIFFLVALGVILLLLSSILRKCNTSNNTNTTNNTEPWINYKRGMDNQIRTGISGDGAPAFYIVPEYRKPYDWPRGFFTNNPVPHIEPLVSIN